MAITEKIKGKAGGLYGEESNQILTYGGSGLCFRNGDSSREDRTMVNQLYSNKNFKRKTEDRAETSHFLHPLSTDSETRAAINQKTWQTNIMSLRSHPGKQGKAFFSLPWLTGHGDVAIMPWYYKALHS